MGLFKNLFKKESKEVSKTTNQTSERTDILMMSQLAALYISENDEKYHQRYINELVAAGVPKKDAQWKMQVIVIPVIR